MSILTILAVLCTGLVIGYFLGYWIAAVDSKS